MNDEEAQPETAYACRQVCPSCDEPASRAQPWMHSTPRAEALTPSQHGQFLSGYDARRVFFTYVRCPSCSLLYCPTYYSREQLERLYGHQCENMSDVPLSARARTQEPYVIMVSPESLPNGDYLELGADIGLFAQLCSQQARFGHYWMYEPNVGVHAQLQCRLQGLDYSVIARDFDPKDICPDSISLAVAVHVIDHVWEPIRTMRGIFQSMRAGGRLLVVTHDASSLLARLLGGRWPPYTLQHPQLFSGTSLRKAVLRCGFQVTRVVKTVNYFPLTFLLRAGCQVLGMSGHLVPSCKVPQIGLKLGNIALLATKL